MTDTTSPRFQTSHLFSDRDTFVAELGSVYEHSPWVAEEVWDEGDADGISSLEDLQSAMRKTVDRSNEATKLTLIRNHPDLADPAAKAGKLSDMSNREQMNAGLTEASPQESQRFAELNVRYKEKFGFPFVIAVKGLNRDQILSAFEQRLSNSKPQEMQTALEQIHQIASFRLSEIFDAISKRP